MIKFLDEKLTPKQYVIASLEFALMNWHIGFQDEDNENEDWMAMTEKEKDEVLRQLSIIRKRLRKFMDKAGKK